MIKNIRKIYQYLAKLDLIVLVAGLLLVSGVLMFIKVLDNVWDGESQRFDEWAIHTIGGWETRDWVREIGRDLTALGGTAVLTLVTLAVTGYLLLMKKYRTIVLLLVATLGALLLSSSLKAIIDRPRPELVPHGSYVYTASFPSGHSMLSAAVYLTLGTMLARQFKDWTLKFYFISIAVVLTGLVGISRVFLGVHWPTDVLAGWSAGLAWAILCWIVARYLQLHGQVEEES